MLVQRLPSQLPDLTATIPRCAPAAAACCSSLPLPWWSSFSGMPGTPTCGSPAGSRRRTSSAPTGRPPRARRTATPISSSWAWTAASTRTATPCRRTSTPRYTPVRPRTAASTANVLMLLHIPGDGSKASVISIARDDYVDLVGCPDKQCKGKIKQAYGLGYAAESAVLAKDATLTKQQREQKARDAGRSAQVKTVAQFLAVPVDHFVEVTMVAFYQLAQVVQPITVCVKEATQDSYSVRTSLRENSRSTRRRRCLRPAAPRPLRPLQLHRPRPRAPPAGVHRVAGDPAEAGRHPGQPGQAAADHRRDQAEHRHRLRPEPAVLRPGRRADGRGQRHVLHAAGQVVRQDAAGRGHQRRRRRADPGDGEAVAVTRGGDRDVSAGSSTPAPTSSSRTGSTTPTPSVPTTVAGTGTPSPTDLTAIGGGGIPCVK